MNEPRRLCHYEVIVIGAGLSGLLAAAALAQAGARVFVVAKGGGYLHFTAGCLDVLGANLDGSPAPPQGASATEGRATGGEGRATERIGAEPPRNPIVDPLAAIAALIARRPGHPYALAPDALAPGVQLFREIVAEAGYPFAGDLRHNLLLPTALGSLRPTCYAPTTMIAGDVARGEPMLIAGFAGFRDFYPPYLAANLSSLVPFPVDHLDLDLPQLRGRRHLLSLDLARALDDPALREAVAHQVRANLGKAQRVGFPAVLGLECPAVAADHLASLIGVPVFEIPTLPPSVPGIRLQNILRRRLLRRGTPVEIGFWVTGRLAGRRVSELSVQSAGHATTYRADAVILATGGIGGGGISALPDGSLRDTVFGLPVEGPDGRTAWFRPEFLGPEPQPISLAGIRTDEHLRPLTPDGPIDNLFVTASNVPGWDPTREKSGEGVALATGWHAAQQAWRVISAMVPA